MRLFLSLSLAAVLAAFLLAACNSTEQRSAQTGGNANQQAGAQPAPGAPAAPQAPSDGVRRITTVELKNALDKGEAVVVDVRGASAYEAGHIKGALLIPTSEFVEKMDTLPRDKMIVTYCS